MPNADTATAIPGRTRPPWTADRTVYFYGGWLSNFAPTPGLRLPFGYHGHHDNDRVPVRTVEHWFQACKGDLAPAVRRHPGVRNRRRRETGRAGDGAAPRLGAGQVRSVLCALRGKFALEPYYSALLLTHPQPLAENSPSDFVWGARDADGGHGGQNLLGLALMRVRDELIADVRTRVTALSLAR
jgi:predicted NAD-dependent protein-ADP-ribosyltransferase YbiA (DUF1768 family)